MKERSKIQKKILLTILLMEAIILATILFIIIFDNYSKNNVAYILILSCLGIIIPFVFIPLFKPIFEVSEIRKESIRYVQQHLSKEHSVEVIPIRDDPRHENFVTKELAKRAKFYAQIMYDGTVMISIQFNNENSRIYYGGLYAENFTTHFKIINL